MEKEVYQTLIDFNITQKAALCSIVLSKGSVPRKDYPLMLVPKEGRNTGTVGGGRMEFEVIETAKQVIYTGKPILKQFDLTNDNTEADGSLCGGITKILIEPFTRSVQNFWKSIDYLNSNGSSGLLVTALNKTGDISPSRSWYEPNRLPDNCPEILKKKIDSVIKSGKPHSFENDNTIQLIQLLLPPPVLHIFGAGHVGKAVADIAYFIDLDAQVYDDREEFLNSERFPDIQFTKLDLSSNLDNQVSMSPQDYALVATRGHHQDLHLMHWLIKQNLNYVGLVSSQRKWKILSASLEKEGISGEQINKIHSPVGLDIQAETVPEIAVSVITEIIHHHRKGYRSTLSLSGDKE